MNTRKRRKDQAGQENADMLLEMQALVEPRMREATLALMQGLFMEEVEPLCGSPFSRKGERSHHRGGSDPGSVILAGQRMGVKKPRMKKNNKDMELASYRALRDFDLLLERVLRHLLSGVATCQYDGLLDEVAGGLGLKKSSVSKAFIRGSRQMLDEINGRDLSDQE